jgi:hypothetical protein
LSHQQTTRHTAGKPARIGNASAVRTGIVGVISALVLLAAPAAASANITVTEGNQFSGVVGTVTCVFNQNTKSSNCSSTMTANPINWGDGSSSAATLVKKTCSSQIPGATGTCYDVHGAHTYETVGSYNGSDTVENGSSSSQVNFTASVSLAALTLGTANVTRSGNDVTVTASLTDADPDHDHCEYAASIDWGDGDTTAGTVEPTDGDGGSCTIEAKDLGATRRRGRHATRVRPHTAGEDDSPFAVSGMHTYTAEPSTDYVQVTVTDNADGQVAGPVDSNPIPVPPGATTTSTSAITATTATLNADNITLGGGTVQDCHFEWGPTTTYGNSAPCTGLDTSDENNPQSVSAAITKLDPSTPYYDQLVLTTNTGTVDGGEVSFTTLAPTAAGAPTVTTGVASNVTTTAVELNGTVDSNGGTISDCHFIYGPAVLGTSVPCSFASSPGSGPVAVSASVSGLTPDQAYSFELVATNTGSSESKGAEASFTTLPDCGVQATFPYVEGTGCLSKSDGLYISSPGTTVDLNGLNLVPDSNTGDLVIDPANSQIRTVGTFSVKAGSYTLYDGFFTWTVPPGGGALPVDITELVTTNNPTVEGFPVLGDFKLSFTPKMGASLTANAGIPFGALAKDIGITGALTLNTAPGTGLLTDQTSVTAPGFSLDGIGIKNLKVTYSSATDTWEGGATVNLPTPNKLNISADLAFSHGSFQKFSGSVGGLNFPIAGGVDLQQISVVFGVNPLVIGGGLGLSFGPQVSGKALAGITGNFVYQEAAAHSDGMIMVNGSLTLASFKIASAYFNYDTTSGLVQVGGQFQIGLPDSDAADPTKQPVYIGAALNGALEGSKFDLDANVMVDLNFIDLKVGAEVLVSDKGLAACATLSAYGFSWSPGFGYQWSNGDFDLMWHGCSVGAYETLKLGGGSGNARDAAVGRVIKLLPGRSLLELRGATGAPKVTLRGPAGQQVRVPTASVKPLLVRGFAVLQDPSDKITWIAIQHGGGKWRMTPAPGSSPITSAKDARLLPVPTGSGSVTGKGARRTLKWHLSGLAGDNAVFWEKGADVDRIIGRSTASRGTLHFKPAPGKAGRRAIRVQILKDGIVSRELIIAHYTAAGLRRPGAAKHVTATAAPGGAIDVSWKPARGAQQYLVVVETAGGAHLSRVVPGSRHRLVVSDVIPIAAATVTVTGELNNGLAGPSARASFPMSVKARRTG